MDQAIPISRCINGTRQHCWEKINHHERYADTQVAGQLYFA